MRIVFADDEPLACDLLRALLAEMPGLQVVGEASDGDHLLRLVGHLQPDVVITDVDMPGRDGVNAAAELERLAKRPAVIFVTAHPSYGAKAFDLDAADYVLKPIRSQRLQQAVERARRRLSVPDTAAQCPEDGELWAPTRLGKARVRLRDVMRIQAARDHALIYTAERSYLLRITMAALEARLAGTALRRVHRSAFVRLSAVREVRRDRKGLALVLNNAVIPVSMAYRTLVLDELGQDAAP
jgi:two-component system LytT family response regulator